MSSNIRIKDDHWQVMLNFMEIHPQFARGQFVGPTGKSSQRKLWYELSGQLNSLGHGSKSVEKWQKVSFPNIIDMTSLY